MPEGHTLRRLADDLNAAFAGRVLAVSSPQGRLVEESRLLDGTSLLLADSAGKHLFLEFAAGRIVHVHLGLIGKFQVAQGRPPAPVGQVRLRLAAGEDGRPPAYADLRGATLSAMITPEQRAVVLDRLGADPLRADADPSRAWRRISSSTRPIGDLLMDQEVVAGVGNVYRAEVLFRHRIHPLRPGRTLRRSQFQAMWDDLVALMAEGVVSNRIDTVRPEHTPEAMGRDPRRDDHGGEVYVYRRHDLPCHVCGTRVRTQVLAGRNLFWCPRCQRTFRTPATKQPKRR